MSYVNRNTGGGRTGIIVAVAALHAAAVFALVTGMGVEVVREIVTNLPTHNYPETVPPEPEPAPAPPEAKPRPDNRQVDVVETPFPVLPGRNEIVFELPPPSFPGPVVDPTPANPPAPFKPIAARPRGNPGDWISDNDYPTRDIRLGNEGRAQFLLTIDASGSVTGCRITRSSGHEGLDAATCLHVARRARFEPARNDHGERVAGSYAGTVAWVIP